MGIFLQKINNNSADNSKRKNFQWFIVESGEEILVWFSHSSADNVEVLVIV